MATTPTALQGPIRVRFAPSPTGFLHVGGARTAIYNDLLRQNLGGAFILRIEDTDRERSDEAMTRQIQSALAWVGCAWDEGPFLQSERFALHAERGRELLASGAAYRCFCSTETLEAQRQEAQRKGLAFRYPRTCAGIAPAEAERRALGGEACVARLRMPDEPIRFRDLVRGDLEFPPEALDDFILLRSDGSPTYHMSVVVDDIDMRVTHVLRGEDHTSNTPKHIALFRAFGASIPAYGHLPLILGQDKKRLSKRFGAASVEEFREQGILPQALYNYLALLGWSPGEDREILSRAEMARLFTVERLNSSPAVFDPEKLSWVNAQYLSSLPVDEVLRHAAPFLESEGLAGAEAERLRAAAELHRGRTRTLKELAAAAAPYFRADIAYDDEVCRKFIADTELAGHLAALAARFVAVEPYRKDALEAALRALAAERGLKAGALIHPTRMALTGAAVGPPVFDVVELMGREAAQRHLARFVAFLEVERERGSAAR